MKLRLLFCQLNFHDFCEIDFWNNEILLIQYIWLTYPKLRVGGMSPRFCLNFHYKAEVGIFVCWLWYFYAPLESFATVGRSFCRPSIWNFLKYIWIWQVFANHTTSTHFKMNIHSQSLVWNWIHCWRGCKCIQINDLTHSSR